MHRIACLFALALTAACSTTGRPVTEVADELGIAIDHRAGGTPTLVFLHGWSCNRTHWKEQLPVFAGEHEVLVFDLAGHGDSTATRKEWTVPGLAHEVLQVLKEADLERVILIGHSMGGWVALRAAAAAPDRVIGVIGADTLQDADFEFPREMSNQIVSSYEADFDQTMKQFVTMMFADSDNAEAEQFVLESALATPHEPAIALMRSFPNMETTSLFASAGVPIRCINSSAAGTVQTDIAGNREISDYDAVLMDDVSHYLMLERPEEFNEHLAAAIAEIDRLAN